MRNSVVLTLVILLEVVGNACLSFGMRHVGALDWNGLGPQILLANLLQVFSNPWVVLGVTILLGYFLFYLTALSRLDLSYVLPMTASSYILTALLAALVLGERIAATRWLGTALICAGILLVSREKVPS